MLLGQNLEVLPRRNRENIAHNNFIEGNMAYRSFGFLLLALLTLAQLTHQPAVEAFSVKAFHKDVARDYNIPLTEANKRSIEYIIETLGNSSLISIAKQKSALHRAGSQITAIHPLRFLAFVFTEEKLKAAMHNMNGRAWVWKEFVDGLRGSMDEEAQRGNMTIEQVQDFAATVQLDPSLLYNLVVSGRWKDFILTLITEIPRHENANRYDM